MFMRVISKMMTTMIITVVVVVVVAAVVVVAGAGAVSNSCSCKFRVFCSAFSAMVRRRLTAAPQIRNSKSTIEADDDLNLKGFVSTHWDSKNTTLDS